MTEPARWSIVGPGIQPGDVKVRCSGCGRTAMRRDVPGLESRGCRVCCREKRAFDRSSAIGTKYGGMSHRRPAQEEETL